MTHALSGDPEGFMMKTSWAGLEGSVPRFLCFFSAPRQRPRFCVFKSCLRLGRFDYFCPERAASLQLLHDAPHTASLTLRLWFAPLSVGDRWRVTHPNCPPSLPLCHTCSSTASCSSWTHWLWWRCEELISNWRFDSLRRSTAECCHRFKNKSVYLRILDNYL